MHCLHVLRTRCRKFEIPRQHLESVFKKEMLYWRKTEEQLHFESCTGRNFALMASNSVWVGRNLRNVSQNLNFLLGSRIDTFCLKVAATVKYGCNHLGIVNPANLRERVFRKSFVLTYRWRLIFQSKFFKTVRNK